MKLWNWLISRKAREEEDDNDSKLDELDEKIQEAEEKLACTVASLPDLSRAVASARRVKYRVDGFTEAMYDGVRGVKHG
jgi:hypothetical protein